VTNFFVDPVEARGLVPHPGDDRGLGATLDRNALGAGDRAAADGRGVVRDGMGELQGQCRMPLMEREERQHGRLEVFDVLGLLDLTAFRVSRAASGVGVGRSFSDQILPHPLDGLPRGPDPA